MGHVLAWAIFGWACLWWVILVATALRDSAAFARAKRRKWSLEATLMAEAWLWLSLAVPLVCLCLWAMGVKP